MNTSDLHILLGLSLGFQSYLLENCEVAKELKELDEAFEDIGEALE